MANSVSLKEYLNRLADRAPTPGGGSAAALVAALGTALLSMAGKYIFKKAKGKNAEKNIRAILRSNEKALRRLASLMRKDEQAYLRLARELRKKQPKNLLKIYKDAVEVPVDICRVSADEISNCARLCVYARTSIISDIAEAALLLDSAFLSAKLNADINLRGIVDPAYKNSIGRMLRGIGKKVRSAKRITLKKTDKFLKRG